MRRARTSITSTGIFPPNVGFGEWEVILSGTAAGLQAAFDANQGTAADYFGRTTVDVIVYGDGSQERDFTYVDDIAEGTVRAIKISGFNIVNLGNDKPIKITDLIKIIEKKLQKKALIVNRDLHLTDVPGTWADISKAKQILDWTPSVDIEKGLELTVDWYLENKDLSDSINL